MSKFRSLVFSHADLAAESRFGDNLRRDLARWFPSTTWAAAFEHPGVRRVYREDRRAFMRQMGAASSGLLLPGAGCAGAETALIVGVVFQAIKVAQEEYDVGSGSGGSATFGNGSQSRERAQLGTQLMLADSRDIQDENEEFVQVPAQRDKWTYAFEGLVSAIAGDHVISGTAVGLTLLTKVFAYL